MEKENQDKDDDKNIESKSETKQNSDKSQTYFMIGIALLVVGIAIIFIGYSQPRVYEKQSDDSVSIVVDSSEVEYTVLNQDNEQNIVTTYSNTVKNTEKVVDENSNESVTYPLNLNTATYEELMTIKGIGEKKASLIVNYRKDVGKFNSVDDLKNIKGFGDATVEKLAPYLTV